MDQVCWWLHGLEVPSRWSFVVVACDYFVAEWVCSFCIEQRICLYRWPCGDRGSRDSECRTVDAILNAQSLTDGMRNVVHGHGRTLARELEIRHQCVICVQWFYLSGLNPYCGWPTLSMAVWQYTSKFRFNVESHTLSGVSKHSVTCELLRVRGVAFWVIVACFRRATTKFIVNGSLLPSVSSKCSLFIADVV